jgi:hypothetical protein
VGGHPAGPGVLAGRHPGAVFACHPPLGRAGAHLSDPGHRPGGRWIFCLAQPSCFAPAAAFGGRLDLFVEDFVDSRQDFVGLEQKIFKKTKKGLSKLDDMV